MEKFHRALFFLMCRERERLTNLYQDAVRQYLAALRELRSRMATSARNEYHRLLRETERAREISDAARHALIEHLQTHRCNS